MKKVLIKIRPFIKYFLVFFFFLFWNLIVQPIYIDENWNYGFAHNIYNGLIPYKDFNMVLTPLFPFIMSFPFFIFGSSILIFHIEQAIILTISFLLIYNYLKEKSLIVLFFIIFPLSVAFPSYNFFLFFLFLILIKLEDIEASDYLIGFILASVILTKHTVGVIMLLPTLYYIKKPKKIFKRFIGCLIPGILFILYLLFTGSFMSFLDLCVLGLFDFGSSNGELNIYFILSIILMVFVLYLIKKDKNNINNYYFLAFCSNLLPLFDLYHFQLVFVAFVFILLLQVDIKIPINLNIFIPGVIIGLTVVNLYYRFDNSKIIYPNNINHYEYRLISSSHIEFTNKINELMDKYSDKKIVFLSADGYYFRIINDQDISYLDLINMGNWGYNGSSKLLNKVKELDSSYIYFLDTKELGMDRQTDQKLLNYVLDNGKKIDGYKNYEVYILEGEV